MSLAGAGRNVLRRLNEGIRDVLALALVVLFALVVTITLLTRAGINILAAPDNWNAILEETRLAERSRALLADFLVSYALQTDQDVSFLEDFSLQIWEGVAEIILPISWFEDNLNAFLETSLDWLAEEQTPLPDITLDLKPVLQALRSPQGALAILPLLQDIPACSKDTRSIEIMGESLATCLPENYDLTDIAQDIAQSGANILPEQVSVTSLQAEALITTETYRTIEKVRAAFHALEAALIFGLRASLLILGVYALLQSASLIRFTRTLTWPLFAASGVSLALLGIWYVFLQWGLGLVVTSALPGIRLEIQALLADVIRASSRLIIRECLVWATALLGAALLMQVLALMLRKIQSLRVVQDSQTPQRTPLIRKQFR